MHGNGKFTVKSQDNNVPVLLELLPSNCSDSGVRLVASIDGGEQYCLGIFKDGKFIPTTISPTTAERLGLKRNIIGHILIG